MLRDLPERLEAPDPDREAPKVGVTKGASAEMAIWLLECGRHEPDHLIHQLAKTVLDSSKLSKPRSHHLGMAITLLVSASMT